MPTWAWILLLLGVVAGVVAGLYALLCYVFFKEETEG